MSWRSEDSTFQTILHAAPNEPALRFLLSALRTLLKLGLLFLFVFMYNKLVYIDFSKSLSSILFYYKKKTKNKRGFYAFCK